MLDEQQQAAAIQAMLSLPDDISLPEPRSIVPVMTDVHRRHERLNLLNLEAVAAAMVLDAEILLSPKSAAGRLPAVLEAEAIPWRQIEPS